MVKLTTQEFIKKAEQVHGNKYDYNKVDYIGANKKVEIICQKHGVFLQKPGDHLFGKGCSLCKTEARYDVNEFIDRAKKVHGDKYDYSKVNYIGREKKVEIICPEHGSFWQLASSHTTGFGCFKCGCDKSKETKIKDTNWFINRAKNIHGDTYDYSKSDYKGKESQIEIICSIHGSFWQLAGNHIHGAGCLKCGQDKIKKSLTFTTQDFIENAKKVHGNKYDYSKVNYISSGKKVEIICPKHGSFFQKPNSHTTIKSGCPKCGHAVSKTEVKILEYVKQLYSGEILTNRRDIIKPKELDIYIPELKLAIEFNGTYYHSTKFKSDIHINSYKIDLCQEKGIQLLSIFEYDWNKPIKQAIIKDKLKQIIVHDYIKIMARKCSIENVSQKEYKTFAKNNNLQGYYKASNILGLYYNNELLQIIAFNKNKIVVECVKLGYYIKGGTDKLLKHFIDEYNPDTITVFYDRAWPIKTKFRQDKIVFDYKYVRNDPTCDIISKRGYIKATDKAMYLKIYDCGKIRFIWSR
jgi:predicted  nucleic acid-binding Zn-ribbon protein